MYSRTSHVQVRVDAFIAKLNNKGNVIQSNPKSLRQAEFALVEIVPSKNVYIEAFSEYPSFGRVILHSQTTEHSSNLLVGIIKEVMK